MALTFHVKPWKPWTPRHPKSFSPRKCPNSRTPESRNPPPPPPAPRCDVYPNTMLPPKHGLPLKPPAKVCVPISGNTQPCALLSSPSQPREMSLPPPSSENLRHGVSSLCDLAHHTLNSHPTSARDIQDNISDTPTELPPLGRGATGTDSSSLSKTSSDGSLEDFCRLLDLQNNIPIDPVILADNAPWDISDLHQPVQQGDDLANPKAIYPYPEPPLSMSCDPFNHHQGSEERPDSWNRNSQTVDDTYVLDHWQIHPARCGTDVDVPCSYSMSDDFLSDEQSRRRNSTSVCSSFLDCLKVLWQVACLIQRQQYGEMRVCGQLVGRPAPHKVGETQHECAARGERATETSCGDGSPRMTHGSWA
ncbi:hypothetical protein PAAG_01953 [Paracoccidioides lutzii Pb01]|uniref:Uncharacterized protein n=1 Tax=Paracoccidioides lutzii (strain ATCC MYA-826 / Pb01) TaxID=502779 RepID=C1GTV8_PARBA|nr:hypothetical protein PAAG_01953 [Paracoccidioides lutzii Pb01]EEH39764.2 hypothetical protein PAAG_01953 [Paracoccidioides lutzii Pb01]